MTNQKVKPYRCNANDKQYKTARKLAGHDGALVCFSCSNSECLTHSWCAGGPRGTVTDGEYVAENHERSHLAEVDELITISSIHGSVRHSCKTCVHHQAIHTTHWFNSRPNATDTVTLINTGEYEVTERKFIHINPQGVAFMHTESQFIRDGKVLCSHSGEGSPARQWIRQIQQNVQFNTFIASMESANAENQ